MYDNTAIYFVTLRMIQLKVFHYLTFCRRLLDLCKRLQGPRKVENERWQIRRFRPHHETKTQ